MKNSIYAPVFGLFLLFNFQIDSALTFSSRLIYFPPHQYSSNLAAMGAGKPLHMKQYETRFKQCLLPDVVHLEKANFDLHIPEKWKGFQCL